MHNLRLNQVTLAAKDMAASVLFYEKLGLTRIVDSAPRYVRFEFPDDGQGTPATLSLHAAQSHFTPSPDTPLIYFEVDDVKAFLADKCLTPLTTPEMKSYLWFEADIEDPSGNRIRIYTAGKNRRFPPWRVGTKPTQ
jgi:catechol 2,3-dioxygenase-like lactoylglutathione lyase family enzyme